MTLVAVWLALLTAIPHVAIAVGPVIILFGLCYLRKRLSNASYSQIITLDLAILLTGISVYFVSVGPVIAMDNATVHLGPSVFKIVYFPVFWLSDRYLLEDWLISYAEAWGWQ